MSKPSERIEVLAKGFEGVFGPVDSRIGAIIAYLDEQADLAKQSQPTALCICDPEDVGPMGHEDRCPQFVQPKPTAIEEPRQVEGADACERGRCTPHLTEMCGKHQDQYEAACVRNNLADGATTNGLVPGMGSDAHPVIAVLDEYIGGLRAKLSTSEARVAELTKHLENAEARPDHALCAKAVAVSDKTIAGLVAAKDEFEKRGAEAEGKLTEAERAIAGMRPVVEAAREAERWIDIDYPGGLDARNALHATLSALDAPTQVEAERPRFSQVACSRDEAGDCVLHAEDDPACIANWQQDPEPSEVEAEREIVVGSVWRIGVNERNVLRYGAEVLGEKLVLCAAVIAGGSKRVFAESHFRKTHEWVSNPAPSEPSASGELSAARERLMELEQRLARVAELAHDRDDDDLTWRSRRLGQCAEISWDHMEETFSKDPLKKRSTLKWAHLAAQLTAAEDKIVSLEAETLTLTSDRDAARMGHQEWRLTYERALLTLQEIHVAAVTTPCSMKESLERIATLSSSAVVVGLRI